MDAIKNARGENALEIGCGCGLISLELARKNIEVVAIDISMEACRNTLANAKNNGLQGFVNIVNGDLATALRVDCSFDIVASNPPYLPVEPSTDEDVAWAAGEENPFSKCLLENAIPLLSDNGFMLFVQSSKSNLDFFKKIIEEKGFQMEEVCSKKFFFERIVVLKMSRTRG